MDIKANKNNGSGEKNRFLGLADFMVSDLSKRSREILKKRYGMSGAKKETLENIGRQYGITRERVRQIISEGLKNISKKTDSAIFKQAEEKIIFTINRNNGIIKETDIISKFNLDGQPEANAIKFFVECSNRIMEAFENNLIEKSWAVSGETVKFAKNVIIAAEQYLSAKGEVMVDSQIYSGLKLEFSNISKNEVLGFLALASRIKKNKFGKWGMSDWSEITPKGTREKVYLVLKEHGKSLHFSDIAGLIDRYELGKRKSHPQTVHNELIKDSRFVLIGRGTYALKEWGYFDGTVKDVLKNILLKSGHPLDREEIMAEVMKMRKVKKATVAINLNDSKIFLRQKDLYSIKKTKN